MCAFIRRGGRLLSTMAYPSAPVAPEELLSRLPTAFERARTSGELFYFPSTSHDIDSNGRRVNLQDWNSTDASSTCDAAQLCRTRRRLRPNYLPLSGSSRLSRRLKKTETRNRSNRPTSKNYTWALSPGRMETRAFRCW